MSEINDALTLDEVYEAVFNLIQNNRLDNFNTDFTYLFSSRYKLETSLRLPPREDEKVSHPFDGVILKPIDSDVHNISALKFHYLTIDSNSSDKVSDFDIFANKFNQELAEIEFAINLATGINHGFNVYISDNYDLMAKLGNYLFDKLSYIDNYSDKGFEMQQPSIDKNKLYVLVCMSTFDNSDESGRSKFHHQIDLREKVIPRDSDEKESK